VMAVTIPVVAPLVTSVVALAVHGNRGGRSRDSTYLLPCKRASKVKP
jgi:hypothetical protein